MNEDPKDVVQEVFEKVNAEDTFARLIGMRLVELQPGYARTIVPVNEEKVNIYRMAHGGVIFSIADQACEAAGNSYGEPAVALQNSIHFLAASKAGDLLEATARVTRRTQRIGWIDFEVKNQEEVLLARGQQLIYFKGREGGRP